MSIKAIAAQIVAITPLVSNEVTDDGVITALELEQMVLAGISYGAWFKIIAAISVVSVILVNLIKIVKTFRNKDNKD